MGAAVKEMLLVLFIISIAQSQDYKFRGTTGFKKKAFSQEVRLLACSLKTISACRKKYSLLFSWPRKATHCFSLRKKKGKHKSFGERQRVDGCSGKGRVAHPVHHEHYTSHK